MEESKRYALMGAGVRSVLGLLGTFVILLSSCCVAAGSASSDREEGIPTLVVDTFRVDALGEQFEKLSAALRSNGLIAIQPDDSIEFSHARDVAFAHMCLCWNDDEHFVDRVQGTDSGLLNDGKTRRITLGTATMGKTPLPLPVSLVSACGQDTVNSLDYLRDHVALVADAFVAALDRLLQGSATGHDSQPPYLLRNKYGGTYPTVQSIVKAAKHLEHFHVYSKPKTDSPTGLAPSMHLHTDAGLFLAFVPGQACENSSFEKDNQSFYVEDPETGQLRRAVFPPGSVAIMLGAGAEHWLQTSFPLAATRHTVRMSPGEARAWYGMMHLVPETAYIQNEPLRTFDEMRQSMVLTKARMADRGFGELPGADEDISVGCGAAHPQPPSRSSVSSAASRRRRLQHVEGPQSCNNSTNFFCWMSCLEIPDAKSAQGYINEGYSLYCLDPSVLASSGNRVSQAVKPCDENGQMGTAMNTDCMGKWEPTAPGVRAQDVIVQGAQNGDIEEQFCYGGTSMYMNGFNWVGTTCAIYLFPDWVLSSAGKLVAACIGSMLFGVLMEYLIRLRRDAMSAAPSGPRYKRLALAAAFYGVQLTMGYSLMLVIMIYSVPLFISVVAGLTGGHVLFNTKDSIIPAKRVQANPTNPIKNAEHNQTVTMCEGPCEEPCEQIRCETTCKGSCCCDPTTAETDDTQRSRDDHGVSEGITPCCQHTQE